jgi:hypothetical protein
MDRIRDMDVNAAVAEEKLAKDLVGSVQPLRLSAAHKARLLAGITHAAPPPRLRRLPVAMAGLAVAAAAVGVWTHRPSRQQAVSPATFTPGTGVSRPQPAKPPAFTQAPPSRSAAEPEVKASDPAVVVPRVTGFSWHSGFETGDLSEWHIETKGYVGKGVFKSARQELTTDVAHTGTRAMKFTMDKGEGMTFLYREDVLPQEGYFGAWFYFPERYTVARGGVWSVFRFTGRRDVKDPKSYCGLFMLRVQRRADGEMAFNLWDEPHMRERRQASPVAVPVGQWVHVEAYYRPRTDDSGRIVFWQDGVEIFDVNGQTAFNEWFSWSLSSIGKSVSPVPAVVYVDDASISWTRPAPP